MLQSYQKRQGSEAAKSPQHPPEFLLTRSPLSLSPSPWPLSSSFSSPSETCPSAVMSASFVLPLIVTATSYVFFPAAVSSIISSTVPVPANCLMAVWTALGVSVNETSFSVCTTVPSASTSTSC